MDGNISQLVHPFGPDWSITTTMRWTAMEFGSEIHVPLKMKWNNVGDPLPFDLAPAPYYQIPAQRISKYKHMLTCQPKPVKTVHNSCRTIAC